MERQAPAGAAPRRLGKYELIARIGVGGMAEVHVARMSGPMKFEKIVVVKTIHPELNSQEQFLSMLLDEARVSALIRHPRVVDIYDLGHEDGTYFIAMEYLDGQPLSAILGAGSKGNPLDPYSAARIIADAAEGLHAAHELRSRSGKPLDLVHRDVSPGNIIVLYDGNVKIVDFGIAKARGRLTSSGARQLKGKMGYVSPEQLTCQPVDRRSDVYSLGVVLWESLTLKRLFAGDQFQSTLDRMNRGDVALPSTHRPQVPPQLDEICLRALAPRAEERFQTAGQMKEAIEFVLRGAGYQRDAGAIAHYMTHTFAIRRAERHQLLAVRADSVSGVEVDESGPVVVHIDDDDSGANGTVELSPPPRTAPAPVTEAAPRRRAPWAWLAVLLLGGAAIGWWQWRGHRQDQHAAAPPETRRARRPVNLHAPPAAPSVIPIVVPVESAKPVEVDPAPPPPAADKPAAPRPAKTAQQLYQEGSDLFVQGKHEAAKQRFKQAIEVDSRHAPAYRGLGLTYQAAGRKDRAVWAFKRYLRLSPNAGDAAAIEARIARLEE